MRRMTHITGRVGIVLGAISALLLSAMGPAMAVPVNAYYASGSFIYSRADVLPIDSALTSSFRSFMATHADQKAITWPKLNMNANWAMSYAYSSATDPIWKLTGGNTTNAKLAFLRTTGFHMPDSMASSFPSGNQDRPGVVIDRASGFTVQFADAVPNLSTRTITVSNAGIMWHGSNALDYRNPKTTDKRNFTSRGRIIDSMIITREELDQAVAAGTGVGKVLHLFFVETDGSGSPCFVHPMVSCESDQHGWGKEGTRIRLSAAGLQRAISAGLTGHALAIARTLYENGAYLGDNSGSSTQIKLSQASHYTGTNLVSSTGAPLPDALKGKVFWSDFEVVTPGAQ